MAIPEFFLFYFQIATSITESLSSSKFCFIASAERSPTEDMPSVFKAHFLAIWTTPAPLALIFAFSLDGAQVAPIVQ